MGPAAKGSITFVNTTIPGKPDKKQLTIIRSHVSRKWRGAKGDTPVQNKQLPTRPRRFRFVNNDSQENDEDGDNEPVIEDVTREARARPHRERRRLREESPPVLRYDCMSSNDAFSVLANYTSPNVSDEFLTHHTLNFLLPIQQSYVEATAPNIPAKQLIKKVSARSITLQSSELPEL